MPWLNKQTDGQKHPDISQTIQIKTAHLYKLHGELAVESGHLSLHTQLASSNGEGDYLVMSGAVTHSIKDIQVLYHHMAV